MILGLGNDIIDIRRVERTIERYGDRFLSRVFTDIERRKSDGRAGRAASYAKRFAAKEACAKALGTGFRQGVFWRDMGVVNLPSGRPTLELTGGALQALVDLTPEGHAARIDLTITDDFPMAQAIVIISAFRGAHARLEPFASQSGTGYRGADGPRVNQHVRRAPHERRGRRNAGEAKRLKDTVRVVIHALILALLVRIFLFQPFNIPSGSMMPTLLVGDYLFVSKYATATAGIPFPFGPNLFSGRIWAKEPERGDVVVFKLPRDNQTDYIKRVIGLPGDEIQMI